MGSQLILGNRNLLIAFCLKNGQTVAYMVAEPTLIISNGALDHTHNPIGRAAKLAIRLMGTRGESKRNGGRPVIIVVPGDAPHQQGERCCVLSIA